MSTLSNIFATDDGTDQDASATSSSSDAYIEPGTPGYPPDNPDDQPPPVLVPGGEGDPTA